MKLARMVINCTMPLDVWSMSVVHLRAWGIKQYNQNAQSHLEDYPP